MGKLQMKRFKMSSLRILKKFRKEWGNLQVKIGKSTGSHFHIELIKMCGVKRCK